MNEMVERVKQTIRAELIFEGDYDPASFEDAARAAIAAMREPTKAMVQATDWSRSFSFEERREIWITMIDAALEPNNALIEQHGSSR